MCLRDMSTGIDNRLPGEMTGVGSLRNSKATLPDLALVPFQLPAHSGGCIAESGAEQSVEVR